MSKRLRRCRAESDPAERDPADPDPALGSERGDPTLTAPRLAQWRGARETAPRSTRRVCSGLPALPGGRTGQIGSHCEGVHRGRRELTRLCRRGGRGGARGSGTWHSTSLVGCTERSWQVESDSGPACRHCAGIHLLGFEGRADCIGPGPSPPSPQTRSHSPWSASPTASRQDLRKPQRGGRGWFPDAAA